MVSIEMLKVILEEIGFFLARHLSRVFKRKLFSAEKWVAKHVKFEKYEVRECWKEKFKSYPMRAIWITLEVDNRSRDDIQLDEALIRIYVNKAPIRTIVWNKSEKIPEGCEEFIARLSKKHILFANKKGSIDIFVNLPPYINTQKNFWLIIGGYLIFDSSFGSFRKDVGYQFLIQPKQWK